MPSRNAHRHALRRSKEPAFVAPKELAATPPLPDRHGWRNPLRGEYYQRDEWELYRVHPHASITLATVYQVHGDAFAVFTGTVWHAPDFVGPAAAAFAWATALTGE